MALLTRFATLMWVAIFLSSWLTAEQPTRTREEIAKYCAAVSAYGSRHPEATVRFSATPHNADPVKDHWRTVATQEQFAAAQRNGNSSATVVQLEGHTVMADFTFQNQFGDFTQSATYCYREDGSLAQLHATLKSFHAGLGVSRESFYDASSRVIDKNQASWDLVTNEPKALPADFWDQPPPVFLRVSDLPFARDLPAPTDSNSPQSR